MLILDTAKRTPEINGSYSNVCVKPFLKKYEYLVLFEVFAGDLLKSDFNFQDFIT